MPNVLRMPDWSTNADFDRVRLALNDDRVTNSAVSDTALTIDALCAAVTRVQDTYFVRQDLAGPIAQQIEARARRPAREVPSLMEVWRD